MRTKNDLFELVKAMTKSEKRYFTIDAQKSGKKASRYLELFRQLSNMEEVDDSRLKKKFGRTLSADKAYLYDAILRSMRDYRSPKSKAAQIKEKIQDSRYLFERGLYKQCDVRLQEANDIAKELGDELMLLEVARERLLTIKSNKEKNFVEYVESLLQDKNSALHHVNQFFKYSDDYYTTIVKVSKNFHLSPADREEIALPNYTEETKSIKSPQTQHRYLQTLALVNQLKGNKEKVLEYFQMTVNWWHRYPSIKNEQYHRYIVDMCNLIYGLIANRKFEQAENEIEYLYTNLPVLTHEKRVCLENVYLYRLVLLLNSKDYEKAQNLIPDIEKGIIEYGFTNNHLLACNISILYFILGDYGKSRVWSSKVISSINTNLRVDIQILVRIINLICLYEWEDIEKLENEIRSVKRFFNKMSYKAQSTEHKILSRLLSLFKASPLALNRKKKEFHDFLVDISIEDNAIIEPLLQWLQTRERRALRA